MLILYNTAPLWIYLSVYCLCPFGLEMTVIFYAQTQLSYGQWCVIMHMHLLGPQVKRRTSLLHDQRRKY